MADNQKSIVEININPQVDDIKVENGAGGGASKNPSLSEEMPSVTMLLNRKKLTATPSSAGTSTAVVKPLETIAVPDLSLADASIDAAPMAHDVSLGDASNDADSITVRSRRVTRDINHGANVNASSTGEPPVFRGKLLLESLDFGKFQKAIKRHKASVDMRKLDCLGYFLTRFVEMAYLEVAGEGALHGVLGFGTLPLVASIREQNIGSDLLPSVFDVLSQGEIFVGAIESLRGEDQTGLLSLGFSATATIGIFPMSNKKSVTGLWLCTSPHAVEIPAKELKSLKKFLSDFSF